MEQEHKNTRRPIDMFKENNIPMITLDVHISCDTFWNYSYRIPIRVNDYYDDRNTRNINNSRVNNTSIASSTCEIGNIGNIDPMFAKLEAYLVEYVIEHIYEDLIRTNSQRDIHLLLKKSRKFHIHGRTLEDILFPNSGSNSATNQHSMPNNTLYICTHC
jgi:hypothetical protein